MVSEVCEFPDLKIAFATYTPMAGMPWRTMQVCRPFCKSADDVVAHDRYHNRAFPFTYAMDTPEGNECLREADLVIVTAYMKDENHGLKKLGVPIARHYSTEPFRWVEKIPDATRSTVVAQYQARYAPHLDVMPNCIPIDNPMFMPGEKPTDRVVIMYTPSTRSERGWGNKGFARTTEILKRLAVKYRGQVEIVLLENRPYEEVMLARRHAHICIDECVTGSYHSVALEGMSCGAVSICWMDMETEKAWHRLGLDQIPFKQCTISRLGKELETLIENPDYLSMECRMSRLWMETNYSERWQAMKWLTWHNNFLQSFATQTKVEK